MPSIKIDSISEIESIPHRHFLIRVRERDHGDIIPLEKNELLVGRMDNLDIVLDSDEVSRRHMLLQKLGEEYSCLDLNSRNGVLLNGIRIHSAVLKNKDSLQLGDVILLYRQKIQ